MECGSQDAQLLRWALTLCLPTPSTQPPREEMLCPLCVCSGCVACKAVALADVLVSATLSCSGHGARPAPQTAGGLGLCLLGIRVGSRQSSRLRSLELRASPVGDTATLSPPGFPWSSPSATELSAETPREVTYLHEAQFSNLQSEGHGHEAAQGSDDHMRPFCDSD